MNINYRVWAESLVLFWILTYMHQLAHVWVARKLGDDTLGPKGRSSLNPLVYFDVVWGVVLPLLTPLLGTQVGCGRPLIPEVAKVKHGFLGVLLTAAAGPACNAVLSLICAVLAAVSTSHVPVIAEYALWAAHKSMYLAMLNVIPLPPFDGAVLLRSTRPTTRFHDWLARPIDPPNPAVFGFMFGLLGVLFTRLGWGGLLAVILAMLPSRHSWIAQEARSVTTAILTAMGI